MSNPVKKDAILLIIEERQQQKGKHKFTIEHDIAMNGNGELIKGAKYLLTNNDSHYPKSWSKHWKDKFDAKDALAKLVTAGALIAAEIDRRLAEEAPKEGTW